MILNDTNKQGRTTGRPGRLGKSNNKLNNKNNRENTNTIGALEVQGKI